jgi:hypothetical protein
MLHKSNIEFNSVSTYTNKTDNIDILLDNTSVDLFDQNGYHLTQADNHFYCQMDIIL